MQDRKNNGMAEYLDIDFNKEFTHFLPCLSRDALTIIHRHIFQKLASSLSIIPLLSGVVEKNSFLFFLSLYIPYNTSVNHVLICCSV